jgi:hypothetical protein
MLINIYGAPSAGKSTTRAGVFYNLKRAGVNCEEVYEFAKKLTWADRHKSLACQPYVFGKQLHEIEMLGNQVDVIITDCPLLLSRFYGMKYASDRYPQSFFDFVGDQAAIVGGLNFFLNRVKTYNPSGRNQTEAESDEVGRELKAMLDVMAVPYIELDGDEDAAQKITAYIMDHLHGIPARQLP